jgi:hypothetical protein
MERVRQVKRQEWLKESVNKSYRILNNFGKNEGVQIWAEIAGIKKKKFLTGILLNISILKDIKEKVRERKKLSAPRKVRYARF